MSDNNNIILTGIINDITFSHRVNGISYSKATLIVKNSNGKESVINLSFKTNTNPGYKNGDVVSLIGNVRTRNVKVQNQKTSVYVYTYFDLPELKEDEEVTNQFSITGQITKLSDLHTFKSDSKNVQIILKNVISTESCNISSFLPCIAWNSIAEQLSKIAVGTMISITGELRSREYTKYLNATEYEIHVAHELLITHFEEINETEL